MVEVSEQYHNLEYTHLQGETFKMTPPVVGSPLIGVVNVESDNTSIYRFERDILSNEPQIKQVFTVDKAVRVLIQHGERIICDNDVYMFGKKHQYIKAKNFICSGVILSDKEVFLGQNEWGAFIHLTWHSASNKYTDVRARLKQSSFESKHFPLRMMKLVKDWIYGQMLF